MLDTVIVAIVVAGAILYLAWSFRPRRQAAKSTPACGGCAQSASHRQG
jgi:hypothetical protein